MSINWSCDTFVVLPCATSNGQMIFGKNSDRPKGEVQEIVFFKRQQFEPGSQQQCTYISVDSVSETYSTILSKPAWMWGAEMGANEFDLCIGNEAIWDKLLSDKDAESKLLGMDLVRLGLEQSKTASEALEVITGLLKKYGQGGLCSNTRDNFYYHNSFLIADPKEVWVLETVGSEWAAEKVESSYRNISNCLSIGTKIDRMSDQLKETAISNGFWDGKGEFHFAKIFSDDTQSDSSRYEAGQRLLQNYSKDNKFDIKSMMAVLRDKQSGICRDCNDNSPTASSQVSVLSGDVRSRPSCHWFTGTPDPQYSYFKPFIFHPSVQQASDKTCSPLTGPDFRHHLYRRHEQFYERLQNDNDLQQTLRHIENLCIDELEQMLSAGYNEDEDNVNEIDSLFSDSVESELRFYR